MTQTTTQTPTDWWRWGSVALAALGAADAIYLTWIKLYHAQALFCSVGGGCDTVNTSAYSQISGIPVAIFGLGAYLLIAAVLLVEDRWAVVRAYGPLAVFGLALTGTLYSAYLTYLELTVIHAICPYCVISALLITSLLIAAVVRLRQRLAD
jgi:uncharacterized membrane protein